MAETTNHSGPGGRRQTSATGDVGVEMPATQAGAQDFEASEEEGVTLFITNIADLDTVSKALPAQGIKVLSVKLGYKAQNPVSMGSLSAERFSFSSHPTKRTATVQFFFCCFRPLAPGSST